MIELERPPDAEGTVPAEPSSTSGPRGAVALAAVAEGAILVAGLALQLAPRPGGIPDLKGDLSFFLLTAVFAVTGIAILRRDARNAIGWILAAIGIGWGVGNVIDLYGDLAVARDLPGGAIALSFGAPFWAPPVVAMGTSLLLRFPDGRLPSPGWRHVERVAAAATLVVIVLVWIAVPDLVDVGYPNLANPLYLESIASFTENGLIALAVIPVAIVASAVALVRRFRGSTGVERLQMKWLVAAGAIVAVAYFLAMVASLDQPWLTADTAGWAYAIQTVSTVSFVLIPIAVGVAVLRYRLYGIDVVINKAFVYGSLAAFITAAYAGIVVGIGALVGDERSEALSILATVVVAIAFQPVRERVQRVANRLVYGTRATPYDVLSHLSARMTGSFETEDVLPRLARVLVQGTGAARVEVWLRVGGHLRLAAASPHAEGETTEVIGVTDDSLPAIPGATATVAVRDEGELLGALAVRKAAGDALTPPERDLIDDVARQAALLLRNVRLVEELRASRERIVAAQDDERRRLERDVHDGAQQQLVTLSQATRAARSGLGGDPPPALADLLDRAIAESEHALVELRELARGIHPRILTERGLPAALRSLAERSPVPVTVEATEDARLPEAIEPTAYFAVSEALQNVAKYANASKAVVSTSRGDGTFLVRVADDGGGGADPSKGSGLRGLVDRIDAVGGRLEVDSPPGAGTRLTVTLPTG
ncbi:MAG TPA: histidine kinase [Actinomycetota bacterium]|nr:histidine kinase [Actinomycetota bacterium]